MYLQSSQKKMWSWTISFNKALDFCMWALEIDGLQVAPFDQHYEGDGALRARGLNAVNWRAWTERVVDIQNQAWEEPETSELVYRAMHPAGEWQGEPAVREMLEDLWKHRYPHWSNKRKEGEWLLNQATQSQVFIQLRRELRPYHKIIPPLRIFVLGYPGKAAYLVPPQSLMLALGGEVPETEALHDLILHAVEMLADN